MNSRAMYTPAILLLLLFAIPIPAFGASTPNKVFIDNFAAYYRVAEGKVPKLLELGKRAFDGGLTKQSVKCFREVLVLDPDTKEANRYLGRLLVDKQWMKPKDRDERSKRANSKAELWGSNWVTPVLLTELRKSMEAEKGLKIQFMHDDLDGFTLFHMGTPEQVWSDRRLVESTFHAWSIEFGKTVGMPKKKKLSVIIMPDKAALESYTTKICGAARTGPIWCNAEAGEVCIVRGADADSGPDNIVRGVVTGILGLLGCEPGDAGYWFYTGFLDYFVMSREDGETVSIGYLRKLSPDLFGKAQSAVRQGLVPSLKVFCEYDCAAFEMDKNDDMRALAWSFFYILNHEFQGNRKAPFHKYLAGAVSGRSGYAHVSRITEWGVVEKCITAWVCDIPDIETK